MNKTRKEIVEEILKMPIEMTDEEPDNSEGIIFKRGAKIYSSQRYINNANKKYLDPDMSDFSVGFYQIIYSKILGSNTILNDKGNLENENFAGDTMNSFHTIANYTPGAGESRKKRTDREKWPPYLQKYYDFYHCLANFWLVPLIIGRTGNKEFSKAYKAKDYMDRFLNVLKNNKKDYEKKFEDYFNNFENLDFNEVHFLKGIYTEDDKIISFSKNNTSEEKIIEITEMIKKRADHIASKYTDELFEYFKKWNLVDE